MYKLKIEHRIKETLKSYSHKKFFPFSNVSFILKIHLQNRLIALQIKIRYSFPHLYSMMFLFSDCSVQHTVYPSLFCKKKRYLDTYNVKFIEYSFFCFW